MECLQCFCWKSLSFPAEEQAEGKLLQEEWKQREADMFRPGSIVVVMAPRCTALLRSMFEFSSTP